MRALRNTNIRVACVIGFPEGTYTTAEKVAEAGQAVEAGALELDMVMDWALLKRGEYAEVQADVAAVRRAAGAGGGPVRLKVILETSQLTREEIVAACVVAAGAGADFVKTSTGFCEKGATVENVRLMKAVVAAVGHGVEVKASGGVRTLRDCDAMMEAGASRIGTSNGVAIMEEGMAAAAKGGEARADGEGEQRVSYGWLSLLLTCFQLRRTAISSCIIMNDLLEFFAYNSIVALSADYDYASPLSLATAKA